MPILVLGSWRASKTDARESYWALRNPDEFGAACVQLGEQLARISCSVVVCDDSPHSAEHHLVSGIVSGLRGRTPASPMIRVIRNYSTPKQPFEELARQHDRHFATEPDVAKDVPDARLMAVRMSDVVLAVAGAESTYEAGLISIINRKRLVPIGSFGGAGSRLMSKIGQWRSSGLHVPNTIPTNDELAQLADPWSPSKIDTVSRLLDIRSFLRLLIIYGRSKDWQSLKTHLHDRLKLPEPVVMSEVFGGTRAFPEKFEEIATPVHAAIAVITPDDLGTALLTGTGGQSESTDIRSPRARQNVWLEIGWFWGALGRRLILLHKRSSVEFPQTYTGSST